MTIDYYNSLPPTPLTHFLGNHNQYRNPREVKPYKAYLTSKSFRDIAMERTKEILKEQSNICLLWSGGLDSTLIFHLFKELNIPFTVLMTEMSQVEHFDLHSKIVSKIFPQVDYIQVDSSEMIEFLRTNPQYNYVTGDNGDQVFLSGLVYKFFYQNRHLPYRIVVPKGIIEFTEPYTSKVLTNSINASLANWCWALDFIYRWDKVNLLLPSQAGYMSSDNFIPFFYTEDFENYSVTNQIVNSRYSKFTDKADLRAMLRDFGEENYVEYKTKIGSQQMFYFVEDFKMNYYQ